MVCEVLFPLSFVKMFSNSLTFFCNSFLIPVHYFEFVWSGQMIYSYVVWFQKDFWQGPQVIGIGPCGGSGPMLFLPRSRKEDENHNKGVQV